MESPFAVVTTHKWFYLTCKDKTCKWESETYPADIDETQLNVEHHHKVRRIEYNLYSAQCFAPECGWELKELQFNHYEAEAFALKHNSDVHEAKTA